MKSKIEHLKTILDFKLTSLPTPAVKSLFEEIKSDPLAETPEFKDEVAMLEKRMLDWEGSGCQT